MGGGWAGYVFVFAVCGGLLALVAGSTLALYLVARIRARFRTPPTVSVTAVSGTTRASRLDDRTDAT